MIFVGHFINDYKGKRGSDLLIKFLRNIPITEGKRHLLGLLFRWPSFSLKLSRSPSPHAMGKESDGRKEVHVITARFSSVSPGYTVLDSLGTMATLPTSLFFDLFILKMDIIKHM